MLLGIWREADDCIIMPLRNAGCFILFFRNLNLCIMKKFHSRSCFLLVALSLLFSAGVRLHGQISTGLGPYRTQTIELVAGWNAVYLEVEPTTSEPADLFAGTPIEIVAAYFRPVTAMQFIDSPNELLADRKGWSVWYAPERDDALLSDLYAIQAHQAYLVYTETPYTWSFEGAAYFGHAQWHPNAYSLVGFPIDAAETPTVQNFFAGVDAHAALKIYRMVNGRWNLITATASTLMEPGKAYWVYSEGASAYAGPLAVQFRAESVGGLVYTINSGAQELTLFNDSPYPQQLNLSLIAGATGQIPLAYAVPELNGDNGAIATSSVPFADTLTISALEPGESVAIQLEVIQSQITQSLMGTTLVIVSDAGPRIEVPIVSVRLDLESSETP